MQLAFRETGLFEGRATRRHLKKCSKCRKLYADYFALYRGLRHVPDLTPPPYVLRCIYKPTTGRNSIFEFARPKIVIPALVLLLAIGIGIRTLHKAPTERKRYSHQEIVQAEKDVHTALTILSHSLHKTNNKIERKNIPLVIKTPIQKSIFETLHYFSNGG
ncbi:hypothetical protein JW935_02285 [candidate division KSB1 bacterium]|nr:hypothetical protein [candidate division KSB1 bacterium]